MFQHFLTINCYFSLSVIKQKQYSCTIRCSGLVQFCVWKSSAFQASDIQTQNCTRPEHRIVHSYSFLIIYIYIFITLQVAFSVEYRVRYGSEIFFPYSTLRPVFYSTYVTVLPSQKPPSFTFFNSIYNCLYTSCHIKTSKQIKRGNNELYFSTSFVKIFKGRCKI